MLERLRDTTISEILKRIESGEATAAEFTAAIKILKDNELELARQAGTDTARLLADRVLPFILPEQEPNRAA
jgi:hypothetical protein